MLKSSAEPDRDIALFGLEGKGRSGLVARLFSRSQPVEVLIFLGLLAIFTALVIPPIVSLVRSALTQSSSGAFTFANFINILPALIRADLLLNTFIFAGATTIISFVFGSLLAWFAERTDAPFRRLLYVSAFLSFALPTVIQVLGWIFLLGRRQGLVNDVLVNRLGVLSSPFDIQSMGGMIFVESILWTAVVFLLMVVPFRSMDATLEEAGRVSRASGPEVFLRITLRLAAPAGLGVILISIVRNLEAFEVPAILGLPGRINVITTQIFTRMQATVLPDYGQISAYSVLLIVLVIPMLMAYHRATSGQGRYVTITGKGLRTTILHLGVYRWIAGLFMLMLPALIMMPIAMLAWVSLLDFYQLPSADALKAVSIDNYARLFGPDSQVLGSLLYTIVVAAAGATIVVTLSAIACWFIIRTRLPGRSLLEFVSVIPLAVPSIVLGVGVLWAYVGLPLPIYGTVGILLIAYMIRSLPIAMRSGYTGVLAISNELEESALAAGARRREMLLRVFLPLMLPAMFTGWQYAFLQTARELPVALLLQSEGNRMVSVWIWNLWEVGQVTNAAALSIVVVVAIGGLGWTLEVLSRRVGLAASGGNRQTPA